MHLVLPLLLSAALFGIGVYGLLARRNAILILMSVELMLNGANVSLVAFDVWFADALHAGQSLAVFVITIAAAEIGLGLAIVLLVYRNRGTIAVDDLTDLRETRPRLVDRAKQ
ncbi:MAG TPA: NADH-quinone oxidoreductase subunit NuoK [Actinomycetes bacterium]|nr:NADH-quinone oxidoreductase subunit NuoK [Actinomycetes bacterium]